MATWELKEGFVWHIYPTSEEAKKTNFDSEDGSSPEYFGFHGLDVSPIVSEVKETEERTEIHLDNAQREYEYFADGSGNDSGADGFLVISDSPESPELVEGWEAQEWDCETGWEYADEADYKIVCVEPANHARESAGTFAVNM
jgi:hypothetical protein